MAHDWEHKSAACREPFALRARMLCGALPSDALHSALSGLLIGHEVARMYEQYAISSTESVVLVGNDALLARYQSVFTLLASPVALQR
jgi:2-dehydro-3-deoxygalactonokinase